MALAERMLLVSVVDGFMLAANRVQLPVGMQLSCVLGPTMQGIGAQQTREQISESIRNPDAVIVEGFPAGIMGATLNAVRFNDTVTEAEFESLVEYLAGQ